MNPSAKKQAWPKVNIADCSRNRFFSSESRRVLWKILTTCQKNCINLLENQLKCQKQSGLRDRPNFTYITYNNNYP